MQLSVVGKITQAVQKTRWKINSLKMGFKIISLISTISKRWLFGRYWLTHWRYKKLTKYTRIEIFLYEIMKDKDIPVLYQVSYGKYITSNSKIKNTARERKFKNSQYLMKIVSSVFYHQWKFDFQKNIKAVSKYPYYVGNKLDRMYVVLRFLHSDLECPACTNLLLLSTRRPLEENWSCNILLKKIKTTSFYNRVKIQTLVKLSIFPQIWGWISQVCFTKNK